MFVFKLGSLLLLTICVVLSQSSLPEEKKHSLRLSKNTIPRLYNIKLEPGIDDENFTFNGTSSITFRILRPTTTITIHASALIQVDKNYTKLSHSNGVIERPILQKWNSQSEFFIIEFKTVLKKGEYQIELKWKGLGSTDYTKILTQGFIRREIDERSYVVATQLKPRGARSVFPCWDEPGYRADFKIAVKHYSNYTAISNMPGAKVTAANDGKIWTSFETTPAMSPHMVNLIIGPYKDIVDEKGNVKLWALSDKRKQMQFIQELSPLLIGALENYTGINYPLPKLNAIYVPDYSPRANEHFGVIIYSNSNLYNPKDDPLTTKYFQEVTLAQGIASQWFGCLVTPEWWNDAWLSGAFPMYFGYKLYHNVMSKRGMNNTLEYAIIIRIMDLGIPTSGKILPVTAMPEGPEDIDRAPISDLRFKGISVLHMLEHIVSEDVMQSGLRSFLKKHKFGSATTEDLLTSLQEAVNEKARASPISEVNYDIKAIIEPWLKQTGYPLVNVTRDYETGIVTITQSDAVDPESRNRWSIPITYATSSQSDMTNATITHWLHPSDKSLQLKGVPKDDWIILNLQLHDFYRVIYDRENWRRIVTYLNTDNYDRIPTLNRVLIMNHIRDLPHNTESDVDLIIDILSYLPRETSTIPLLVGVGVMNDLARELINTPAYEPFKRFSLNLITNTASCLGFSKQQEDDDLTEMLRQELLDLACQLGHEDCKRFATTRLLETVRSQTHKPIGPDARRWIYCTALSTANETVWDMVWKAYHENPQEYLDVYQVLGCTKNKTIIKKFVEFALTMITPGSYDGIAHTFYSLRSDPAEQYNYALDLLLENAKLIREYYRNRDQPSGWPIIIGFMSQHAKTADDQAKMIKLINQEDDILTDLEAYITDVKERVEKSTRISKTFTDVLKEKTHPKFPNKL